MERALPRLQPAEMSHKVVQVIGYVRSPGSSALRCRDSSPVSSPANPNAEAYQCLDASITSHDTFLRSHLDFRSTSDAGKALGLKKLEWFHEVNDRAIRRILAKLERLGQTENPSYRNIQERWQTLQPDWETRFASITEAKSGLVRTETATAISEDGLTQLHSAIVAENAQAASRLVDSLRADGGVSAREVISDALHLALRIQNDDIIHCLLRDGADLTYQSSRGEVALHVAVQVGRVNYAALIIQAMREQGATLDVPDNSRAWTPLFLACADGNAEVVQLLIKAGSNQKQQDRLGWTAKEIAAFRGHLAVADLFKSLDMPSTGGLASALVARHDESLGRINCGPYKSVIIVTLGTTSRDRVVNGVNLSFCSSAYSPGKYDVGSFILEISANGSSERRRVPLPILDDQINSPFIFFVSNNTEPCLVFSILQRMRVPGKEVLVASGAALLTRNSQQFGTHRQSLIREQSVPMMEKDTMRMAGHVTFTPLIVRPFPHLQIPQSIDVTRAPSAPPLLVGHRGAGANIKTKEYLQVGENTVGSFLSAVKLGATFVEFDIQITRDLQAVTFHDLSLSETGTDIPIHDVTLDQFIHASNTQSPHGNPLSMLGTAHSREQAGRPRSRSLGRQFEAGAAQIQDRMKHTVDFKQNGFKPNTRGHFIQDTFATLEEILVALPENIGCDIEISPSPSPEEKSLD